MRQADEPLLHNSPIRIFRGMWASGIFLNCNVYWACPTGCRYCYARLNRESRGAKGNFNALEGLGKFTSLINKVFGPRYDERSATEFFLHERFPVMLSNNSDPLSPLEAEHGYARQYLQVLADLDMPVCILSKFGGWAGLDQDAYLALFRRFSKLSIAITVTSDNDGCLGWWEPGAPSFLERLKIIRQLSTAGIPVEVQCVPFIPGESFTSGPWDDMETYRAFLQQIREAGAYGVTMSPLCFDRNDAQALGEAEKARVAQMAWCNSELDKRWRYFLPDVSIWAEVSRLFYSEARRQGLRCGLHPAFNSLLAEPGDYDCLSCAPAWVDTSISWLRVAHELRELHEQAGRPLLTTTRHIARRQVADCFWAGHEFAWQSWRDSIPGAWSDPGYVQRVAVMPETVTLYDVLHFQLQEVTRWSDCLWSDVCTAPAVYEGAEAQDAEGNVVLCYDRQAPRDSWAVVRAPEWNGRDILDMGLGVECLDGKLQTYEIGGD